MKHLMIALLAGIFLVACNTTPKSEAEGSADTQAVAAEWVEVVLNVDGMTCDGCENAINAGVESLEGIAAVESSHEEGWTKVKYDKSQISAEDIEGKITETGYVIL
jgi:copper chaperone